MEEKENSFIKLSKVDVSKHVEKIGSLNYLSWAWAWAELKKRYPDANYTIYERQDQQWGPINYFTDGRSAWVKVGLTLIPGGLEHIEELPILNYKSQSIPLDSVCSFDVNKTIQRCLTKCIARFGLGLSVYAGEDLFDDDNSDNKNTNESSSQSEISAASTVSKIPLKNLISEIGRMVKNMYSKEGDAKNYQNIIQQITGNTTFKCNAATEADYDKIYKIYQALIAGGYNK